jgi:hypothetical protein
VLRTRSAQTLEATALVHEAYVRLVDTDKIPHWNSRGHFFAAAAEAMRRILIEQACRKQTGKHGGDDCASISLRMSLATSSLRSPMTESCKALR